MHLPGIEPGFRPWKGRVLPLNYRCLSWRCYVESIQLSSSGQIGITLICAQACGAALTETYLERVHRQPESCLAYVPPNATPLATNHLLPSTCATAASHPLTWPGLFRSLDLSVCESADLSALACAWPHVTSLRLGSTVRGGGSKLLQVQHDQGQGTGPGGNSGQASTMAPLSGALCSASATACASAVAAARGRPSPATSSSTPASAPAPGVVVSGPALGSLPPQPPQPPAAGPPQPPPVPAPWLQLALPGDAATPYTLLQLPLSGLTHPFCCTTAGAGCGQPCMERTQL